MRKLIAAINMTVDGVCDHTQGIADDELHRHYNDLLRSVDTVIYGRITYQLMEYWKSVVENPTGNSVTDEFAVTMDNIADKVVFSRTLKNVNWKNARVAKRGIEEEVLDLKSKPGKNILVGGRSLIAATMELNLIDQLQLCIHPVIAGKGLLLFESMNDKVELKLLKTKTFDSGAIVLYYEPANTIPME